MCTKIALTTAKTQSYSGSQTQWTERHLPTACCLKLAVTC